MFGENLSKHVYRDNWYIQDFRTTVHCLAAMDKHVIACISEGGQLSKEERLHWVFIHVWSADLNKHWKSRGLEGGDFRPFPPDILPEKIISFTPKETNSILVEVELGNGEMKTIPAFATR